MLSPFGEGSDVEKLKSLKENDCEHGTLIYNGFTWRCKDCGEVQVLKD